MKRAVIPFRTALFVVAVCLFLSSLYPLKAEASAGDKTSSPASSVASLPAEPSEVLVIGSYDLSWSAEQSMISGLQKAMGQNSKLRFYFMDTKNQNKSFAYTQLSGFMKELKADGRLPDAYVLLDDAAFDFVRLNYSMYFSGQKIVFAGINAPQTAVKASQVYHMTGVMEAFPVAETIRAAADIYPDAHEVCVIIDQSLEGRGTKEQYRAVEDQFPGFSFEFLNTQEYTKDELKEKLQSLSESTILLYGVMGRDGDGNVYTLPQAVRFVSENAPVPVFKADEDGVGQGLIGGSVISYEAMGERAGEMMTELLNGAETESVPVEKPVSYYLFDSSVLERFRIAKSSLPAHAMLINNRETVLEQYASQILTASVCSVIVMLLILVLTTTRSRDRLKAAVTRAQEADRTRSEFFARMSHEMRTPLTGIIGYAQLGLEDTVDPQAADDFRKILTSSDYLLNTINDVLDFRNLETRSMEIRPKAVNITSFLENIDVIIRPLMMKQQIMYENVLEVPDGRVVLADPVRLKQVLINLLGNSAKYTDPGGSVRFLMREEAVEETEDGARGRYLIEVTDTGIGMSGEFLGKIYEPFDRVYREGFDSRDGTGLGMVITKKIVELMNGTMDIKSRLNEGTKVSLTIPFTLQNKPVPLPAADGPKRVSAEMLPGGYRILLVEDNEINAQSELIQLRRYGAEVLLAMDGAEAVRMFRDSPEGYFKLILMDLLMPGMNGFEAAKAIRQTEGRTDSGRVLILAMSASMQEDDRKMAEKSGMNGCLMKPIDRETLLNEMKRLTASL